MRGGVFLARVPSFDDNMKAKFTNLSFDCDDIIISGAFQDLGHRT